MTYLKRTALALAASLFAATGALAQPYPDKPLTLVVPFPPGGSSDIVGRSVSEKLALDLGQTVVVENKAGASGAIGAAQTARSKPDGYTFMVGSIGVLAINPWLFKNLAYDPAEDFDLLTLAVRYPNVLVAHPSFPADTAEELIAYMKEHTKKTIFASNAGASDHLTTHLFWQKTGTQGIDVTYKGSGPAITDLLGGHAQVSFRNLGEVYSQIKQGQLKLLATTSEQRLPQFPDVPTLTEIGVADGVVYSWQGFAAPKGLPAEVKARLASGLVKALNDPGVTKRLNDIGLEVVAGTPDEFDALQAQELERWKAVVESGNIKTN
ncbi:tripartite tricarboxylate transporter substrate binding protein [Aureimonas flava]|uniref:Tripartite tricarboxylate transporter substrate binding protein n=1 Tax=Aureimonas flava TaxID=2320271 RepID=A0A3A1WJ98_9HYPH|nr:tripartite tricarboxylate transporter substrate binding protein [Aureimonas flava]RIX99753.1 tripartite tricarboxylate transporter substrate binding protein [Aureimonas flava]